MRPVRCRRSSAGEEAEARSAPLPEAAGALFPRARVRGREGGRNRGTSVALAPPVGTVRACVPGGGRGGRVRCAGPAGDARCGSGLHRGCGWRGRGCCGGDGRLLPDAVGFGYGSGALSARCCASALRSLWFAARCLILMLRLMDRLPRLSNATGWRVEAFVTRCRAFSGAGLALRARGCSLSLRAIRCMFAGGLWSGSARIGKGGADQSEPKPARTVPRKECRAAMAYNRAMSNRCQGGLPWRSD